MEKYYVYVIEVATGKHVYEFEVVDGNYKEEDAAKYVELMYGEDSNKYRIKINSIHTSRYHSSH